MSQAKNKALLSHPSQSKATFLEEKMATITLSELQTSGAELFQDSESFLNDMNDVEGISIQGGGFGGGYGFGGGLSALITYSIKGKEFVLLSYGIQTVLTLAKSFSSAGGGFI